MPTPPRRGHLAVALVAALLLISASPGGAAVAAEPADPPAAPPRAPAAMPAPPVLPSQPGWRLRWAPQAATDGLGAFEHAEDDRANSHPEASPHIFVEGDHYRFNMHMVDRDLTTDRQRHEVRGLRTPAGHALNLLKGERWRFSYS